MFLFILGCVTGIKQHLAELVPFLITSLGDKKVYNTIIWLWFQKNIYLVSSNIKLDLSWLSLS